MLILGSLPTRGWGYLSLITLCGADKSSRPVEAYPGVCVWSPKWQHRSINQDRWIPTKFTPYVLLNSYAGHNSISILHTSRAVICYWNKHTHHLVSYLNHTEQSNVSQYGYTTRVVVVTDRAPRTFLSTSRHLVVWIFSWHWSLKSRGQPLSPP